MNYTVVWQPSAVQLLAGLWTDAGDRDGMTMATNRIDSELARDPLGVGESRASGRRILIHTPLAVLYRVSEPDCLVTVTAVWRWSDRIA